jgi:hypothetical protein
MAGSTQAVVRCKSIKSPTIHSRALVGWLEPLVGPRVGLGLGLSNQHSRRRRRHVSPQPLSSAPSAGGAILTLQHLLRWAQLPQPRQAGGGDDQAGGGDDPAGGGGGPAGGGAARPGAGAARPGAGAGAGGGGPASRRVVSVSGAGCSASSKALHAPTGAERSAEPTHVQVLIRYSRAMGEAGDAWMDPVLAGVKVLEARQEAEEGGGGAGAEL